GRPLYIECGTRCAKHNAELPGSVPNSAHITGMAADIRAEGMSNAQLGAIVKALYRAGKLPALQYCYLIKGNTNTSVHFDVDKSKAARRGGRVFAF
ncbi:MAG: D-Ala-D-Ala carboxypeptidase family metallohydrolase, partial [Cloacibacillus sp.]